MNSRDKDNFAQAMRELLENSEEDAAVEEKKPNTVALSFGSKAVEKGSTDAKPEGATNDGARFVAAAGAGTTPAATSAAPVLGSQVSAAPQPPPPAVPSGETTVIAPGTKIVGDIEADGFLQVGGSVKGNLKVAATLDLNGRIIGDIEAQDVSVVTSMVKGNVTARETLRVDKDTTIVGDVVARNAEIDGKIKGNVTVTERAHVKSDSVLMGNLVSGTVNVEEGAMLKGDISITSMKRDSVVVEDLEFDIQISK